MKRKVRNERAAHEFLDFDTVSEVVAFAPVLMAAMMIAFTLHVAFMSAVSR
jgi:hypothetical protein